MQHWTKRLFLSFAAAVMLGSPCLAQDVQPPFTWEGKGNASLLGQDGTNEVLFDIELSIDEDGNVTGSTSNEDGRSSIKHVFYSENTDHEFMGLFSKKIMIVTIINEYGDNPLLSIMNGRLLRDRFFYGEVLFTQYESGSDLAKKLGVGNPQATLMESGELPWSVKSALQQCLPFGTVSIEGDYKAEPISLFNGENFDGWTMWSEDPNADPRETWLAKDGAIYCTGVPQGFLRTEKEFSNYILTLEWQWPKEPGNSGVLLHMTDGEKVWPVSMEAQLMNDRAGDLIGMASHLEFNTHENKRSRYAPKMKESNEKASGGWNQYEIICKDDTIELKVNGELQNKGSGVPLSKGFIGFQSEGVPIRLKNIQIKEID